jgi:hypothetical protein
VVLTNLPRNTAQEHRPGACLRAGQGGLLPAAGDRRGRHQGARVTQEGSGL